MTREEILEMYNEDYCNSPFKDEYFKEDIIRKFCNVYNLMTKWHNENKLVKRSYNRMTDTLKNIISVLCDMDLINEDEMYSMIKMLVHAEAYAYK